MESSKEMIRKNQMTLRKGRGIKKRGASICRRTCGGRNSRSGGGIELQYPKRGLTDREGDVKWCSKSGKKSSTHHPGIHLGRGCRKTGNNRLKKNTSRKGGKEFDRALNTWGVQNKKTEEWQR